jgi:hypothetical protein
MTVLLRLFLLLLLWAPAHVWAVDFNNYSEGVLPWPWGSECPFPWTKIEGEWTARGEGATDHFTFMLQGRQPDGGHGLAISRYGKNGELIGIGRGVAPRGERIVRAAMVGIGPEEGKTYWAIVRTYTEKQKKSCARNKQVTVITLKAAEGSDEEIHYVLDREDSVRRAKN